MKKTRIVSLMVALVLLISGVSALAANDAVNPKGVLPIVKEGHEVELSVFIANKDLVTTYEAPTNVFTQELYDKTGIKLTFVTAPSSDAESKLNLMLNTNDYPDIIITDKLSLSAVSMYAEEGVFIPLNDLYEEYGDNLTAVFEEYPAAWDVALDNDGNLLSISSVNDCLHCNVAPGRAWYYQPFMVKYTEETGNPVPETTEAYKEYLTWVRDNDVNGNGDPSDEIPLVTYGNDLDAFRRWVSNSFLPYPEKGYAVIDGKVEAQFAKEEFRDSLRYLADLYAENLILPESFSISREELIRLGESPDPIIATAGVQWNDDWCEKYGASERFFYSWLLPTLAGPEGVQYAYQKGSANAVFRYAYITDKCENPDAAFRLIDFMYDFEITLNGYIGPKGEAWDDPDEGAVGLDGNPALYKLLVNFGEQADDIGWNSRNPANRSAAFRLGEQATGIEDINTFLTTGDHDLLQQVKNLGSYNEVTNFFFAEKVKDQLLPQEFIPPEFMLESQDMNAVADIEASLNPYLDLAYVEFITGIRDINDDAAWETYLSDLENMGLSTICEIYTNSL